MTDSKIKIISNGVGRRKEAIASVRLISGNGEVTVNGKNALDYFPGEIAKRRLNEPFTSLAVSKYSAIAKAHGGGKFGQLDAVVLAISRALVAHKSDYKPALRKAGLMTRDARVRQRRQVGTGGKARRRKQSPKR